MPIHWPPANHYARRHRLRRFDGEYRWVETRAAPMRNAEGTIVQWNVICLDIDGEVRAEEKLRLSQESLARASQAASLAELSASIAHEVNQPLAAVWRIRTPASAGSWPNRRTSSEPRGRSSALSGMPIRRPMSSAASARCSSNPSTRGSIGVCRRRRRSAQPHGRRGGATARTDGYQNRWRSSSFTIDRVQVQQVLVNLIRNGMEAMDSVARR